MYLFGLLTVFVDADIITIVNDGRLFEPPQLDMGNVGLSARRVKAGRFFKHARYNEPQGPGVKGAEP